MGQELDRVDLFQRLLSSQGKLRSAPSQRKSCFMCIDEPHLFINIFGGKLMKCLTYPNTATTLICVEKRDNTQSVPTQTCSNDNDVYLQYIGLLRKLET